MPPHARIDASVQSACEDGNISFCSVCQCPLLSECSLQSMFVVLHESCMFNQTHMFKQAPPKL